MHRILSLFVLLCAFALSTAAYAETARGTVFDDANQNSVRDSGESGIESVRVSDGKSIVLTDAEGNYSIDIEAPAVLFVSKPSAYATPVNAHQLPQFYYIHQPQGSPEGLRYLGIEPTGPLPDRIDFPLTKIDEPKSFEAILFADTQPQTSAELDYIRDDVVAELIGTKARFGMTMGDIMFDDMSLLPRFNAIISQIGVPWYNVPGNHEMNLLAETDEDSLETFKRFFGPPYFSFEVGDAVFIVLDNIHYKGSGESDPGDVRGAGGYEARISEQQLKWLEKELALISKDKLVFVATHAPLKTYAGEPENPATNTQNRRDLFKLLEGREHLYSVAGHTHTTEHHYFSEEDGFAGPGTFHHHVLATVSGSWWSGPIDERGIPVAVQRDGTPNGYHILEVDGVDLSVRFKAAGQSADTQMRIMFDVAHHGLRKEGLRDFREGALFDGRLSVDEVPAAEILVNLYDGGPKSGVDFSIGNGEIIPMKRVVRPDPVVQELFFRNEAVKKPWVQALPSSHIFAADLPDDLGPGTYTVTVRAVDEFGKRFHAHKILEIYGSSAP